VLIEASPSLATADMTAGRGRTMGRKRRTSPLAPFGFLVIPRAAAAIRNRPFILGCGQWPTLSQRLSNAVVQTRLPSRLKYVA
jgi:hypothetical protein